MPKDKILHQIELWMVGVAVGGVPPLVGLLTLWWGSVAVVPGRWVPACALSGLAIGILVDILWLKRWIRRALSWHWLVWMVVYGFYSVGLFGFFMGVPAFNVALALPAGFLVGCRLAREGADRERTRRASRIACLFTTAILAVACLASATIALIDSSTAANLEGMLGLGFDVTRPMIVGLIVIGGAALLAAQWLLTAWTARLTYAWAQRPLKAAG